MPKLTTTGRAITLFLQKRGTLLTPSSISSALSIAPDEARCIIHELETEGKIEAVPLSGFGPDRTRYRWVENQ